MIEKKIIFFQAAQFPAARTGTQAHRRPARPNPCPSFPRGAGLRAPSRAVPDLREPLQATNPKTKTTLSKKAERNQGDREPNPI
ncbi:hypothetical protein APED_21775 [Acanthopleuribacter pedis]